MSGSSRKLRLYFILMAASSIYCDRVSNGHHPFATEVESSRNKSKRGITKRSTRTLPTEIDERKKQHLCLNRLKDALDTVCSSGSESVPLYFDPNSNKLSVSGNATNFHAGAGRKSRHLRNMISAMAQQNRPILRRRSRRQIVRECCDSPCSYEHLRKYCSASTRFTTAKVSSSVTNQEGKNGKLGRSINGHYPTFGVGLSSNYLDYEDPIDNQIADDEADQFDNDKPPYSVQCIPIPDLKSYYRRLYQTQSKKDGQAIQMHTSGPIPTVESSKSTGSVNALKVNPENSTTLSERSNISNPNINVPIKFHSKLSQKKATEETTSRQDNEVGGGVLKTERTSSNSIQRTSNIATVKPITRYINLPRGTNDYIY